MKRSEILHILKKYKKNYHKKYQFSKIGIFGSAARSTAGRESDIDIVIEQSKPDLFLLGTIKTDLEKEFACKVDIIRLRKEMNAFLKDRIDREAIYV
jgi:predicted nucleotidyltransferase